VLIRIRDAHTVATTGGASLARSGTMQRDSRKSTSRWKLVVSLRVKLLPAIKLTFPGFIAWVEILAL
jgi:hypothetical protein